MNLISDQEIGFLTKSVLKPCRQRGRLVYKFKSDDQIWAKSGKFFFFKFSFKTIKQVFQLKQASAHVEIALISPNLD